MTGYKIPEGWAIGWRNAIERYPKDSEYAWGMNAVLESIEALPLEELDDNPWHTGTPKEEGWYIVKLDDDGKVVYDTNYWGKRFDGMMWKYEEMGDILKWQKIEEKEDGRTD